MWHVTYDDEGRQGTAIPKQWEFKNCSWSSIGALYLTKKKPFYHCHRHHLWSELKNSSLSHTIYTQSIRVPIVQGKKGLCSFGPVGLLHCLLATEETSEAPTSQDLMQEVPQDTQLVWTSLCLLGYGFNKVSTWFSKFQPWFFTSYPTFWGSSNHVFLACTFQPPFPQPHRRSAVNRYSKTVGMIGCQQWSAI